MDSAKSKMRLAPLSGLCTKPITLGMLVDTVVTRRARTSLSLTTVKFAPTTVGNLAATYLLTYNGNPSSQQVKLILLRASFRDGTTPMS